MTDANPSSVGALSFDPLHVAQILADTGCPWRDVSVVESTGSTNSDLAVRIAAGTAREGTVIAAAEQTAGRGRLGRTWESPAGTTLSMSVALSPPVARAGFAPLLAGAAVARAIRQLLPGVTGISVKWPNDVLIDEQKVAGILAESAQPFVIVGCGINVSIPRDRLPTPESTSLQLHGPPVHRADLLARCILQFNALYERWQEGGFDPEGSGLLADYRALSSTLGRAVSVHLPDGTDLEGRAVAIDETGRLVVEAQGERRTLAAGDVTHVRAG